MLGSGNCVLKARNARILAAAQRARKTSWSQGLHNVVNLDWLNRDKSRSITHRKQRQHVNRDLIVLAPPPARSKQLSCLRAQVWRGPAARSRASTAGRNSRHHTGGTKMFYCVGGGVVAGVLVGRLASKSDSPTAVFLSAAATALLTGAIGSSCVGVHGIVGMAVGIGLGAVPQGLRSLVRR